MLHRLRSAFLRENMLLIVLRLLREEDLSEWEILNMLHSQYGLTASHREFRRLYGLMTDGGYATVEPAGGGRRLRMTPAGANLLRRLEKEYLAIVSRLDVSSGVMLTR